MFGNSQTSDASPHLAPQAAPAQQNSPSTAPYLKAVVLSQDATVDWLDDHLLLHTEIQSLNSTTGTEQGLVGARFFQPRH